MHQSWWRAMQKLTEISQDHSYLQGGFVHIVCDMFSIASAPFNVQIPAACSVLSAAAHSFAFRFFSSFFFFQTRLLYHKSLFWGICMCDPENGANTGSPPTKRRPPLEWSLQQHRAKRTPSFFARSDPRRRLEMERNTQVELCTLMLQAAKKWMQTCIPTIPADLPKHIFFTVFHTQHNRSQGEGRKKKPSPKLI